MSDTKLQHRILLMACLAWTPQAIAEEQKLAPPHILGVSNVTDTSLRVRFQKTRATDLAFLLESSSDFVSWASAGRLRDSRSPPRSTASMAVIGLSPQTRYCFKVSTVISEKEMSPSSEPFCVTTAAVGPDVEAPAKPVGFELLRQPKFNPISIVLNWTDDATNENGFTLERMRSFIDEEWRSVHQNVYVGSSAGASLGAHLSFVDDDIEPLTDYCYRIFAWNEGGRSDYSDNLCIGIPQRPAALSVNSVGENSISVRWRDRSSNEDKFEVIYYKESTSSGGAAVSRGAAADTQFLLITGLSSGTEYCSRVRAVSASGNSGYTARQCVTTRKHVEEASDQTGISIRIRDHVGGFGTCSGTVQYRLEPISLTGREGRSETIAFSKDFNVTSTNVGLDQWACMLDASNMFLKAGMWRVAVKYGPWVGVCEVTLASFRGNFAWFSNSKTGCKQDLSYP